MLRRRKGVMSYRVYYIDKYLNVVSFQAICYISRLLARENGLHEGGEFILGGRIADQVLPGLIIRVDDGGWIGGRDWIHVRQSQIFRHGKIRAYSISSRWLANGGVQE